MLLCYGDVKKKNFFKIYIYFFNVDYFGTKTNFCCNLTEFILADMKKKVNFGGNLFSE